MAFGRTRKVTTASPWITGRWLFGRPARPCHAIAIPARDEAAQITGCLDACRVALDATGDGGVILLLVNNATDDTVARAAAWARGLPGNGPALDLVDVSLPPAHAHAGGARRLAMDLARAHLSADGVLATTDADTRPAPDWLTATRHALDAGAALVCGRLQFDAAEWAALPAAVRRRAVVEGQYRRLSLRIATAIDPDPADPWPHHGMACGASLAMRGHHYDRVGGLPAVPWAEDRALARHMAAHDLPVRHADRVRVITSCRMAGRAAGGLAATLAAPLTQPDPLSDEDFAPPDILLRRVSMRAILRRHWGQRPGFGAAWAALDAASPSLRHPRMRWSAVQAHLPQLAQLASLVCGHSRLPARRLAS